MAMGPMRLRVPLVPLVNKLYVNGVNIPRGTYGATGSGAEFIDDNHFSGTGWVRVLKDDLAMPLIIRMK